MRLILLVALICLSAQTALAGAWPRTKGSGFVSVASRLAWPQDISNWQEKAPTETYQTLYIEYGLTERFTFGLDVGRAVSGEGKTVGFLQMPLRDRDTGPKVSVQLGFGQISGAQVVRPGLSAGWGLEKGWVSVDGVAEMRMADLKTDFKLDMTWGRNLPRDRKLVIQLQSGVPYADPSFVRFAPSVVVPINTRFMVELGGTYGLTGDNSMGLKIGLWAEF